MFSDFWFAQPMLDEVERHKGDVYLYYYDYNTSYSLSSQFFDVDEYFGTYLICFLLLLPVMRRNTMSKRKIFTLQNDVTWFYTDVPCWSDVVRVKKLTYCLLGVSQLGFVGVRKLCYCSQVSVTLVFKDLILRHELGYTV